MRHRPPRAGMVTAGHIPDLITDLRDAGLTVEVIAASVGVTRHTIKRYGNGRNRNIPQSVDRALRDLHATHTGSTIITDTPVPVMCVRYTCRSIAAEEINGLGHFCSACADYARTVLRRTPA